MYNESKQNRFAQVGGLASVPGQSPGLVNIPLNQPAGQNPVGTPGIQGEGSTFSAINSSQPGVSLDEILYILDRVAKSNNAEEVQVLKSEVSKIKSQLQTPELVKMFDTLEKAIDVNSDRRQQTRNPSTGEKEPLAQDIAAETARRVKQMGKTMENIPNQNIKEAQKKPSNNEGDPKKKKTRGNPFRVLMGQVGKLLDHGMSKRDIVKYILRKGYWTEDTISKAVGVVKDYNKKKKSKPEKSKKSASTFNLHRYSQLIDNNETDLMNKIPFEADNDDGLTPDWGKRSTAELFARGTWLNCLKAYNNNKHRETKKAANLAGATSQRNKIRAELKRRGFSEEELP
jgi:hypothetical protein